MTVKSDLFDITLATGDVLPTSWLQAVRDILASQGDRTAAEIAASVTPVNYSYPEGHVYRYGTNTTPGTTNMATAINNAILVMAQHADGGEVVFPAANCRITSTINAAANVDLVGQGGQSSQITADGVDGITLSYTTYHGRTNIRDLYILGTNSTTALGIYNPGTLNNNDQIYSVNVERCFIRSFTVGIHFTTVWESTINNNRIEDVERAIELVGGNIGSHINNNWIIRTAGAGGAGPVTGIVLNSFNYTSGAGEVPPEGIQINNNLIYGFANGITIGNANYVNIDHNDFYCTTYGVSFTSVSLLFNITDCFFELAGAGLVAGIAGAALAVPLTNAKVNIARCAFHAASEVSAVGVQMNDNSNGGQDFVTIDDCLFSGFSAADIRIYNPGQTWIRRNRCQSSVPTYSITLVNSVLSGKVHIDENHCTKAINWTAADAAAGYVVLGNNTISGTTQLYGSQQVPTVASAASLTLPLGATVFSISGTTNITSIVATGWAGRRVTLIFQGVLTLTDGSNIKINANFVTTADDAVDLVCDGTNWYATAIGSAN